jgi:hypothetical protein
MSFVNEAVEEIVIPSSEDLSQTQLALLKRAFESRIK